MDKPRRLRFDIPLFLGTLVLTAGGIVMVFSASGYEAGDKLGRTSYYMVQQILGAAVGLAVILFLLTAKKSFFLHPFFIYGLLAATAILLLLCFMMPTIARTNRWLVFFGLRFQPSELAKLSLILFLAHFCDSRRDRLNEWKTLAVPAGILGVILILILMEPDFGTAVLLAGLAALTLVIGGVKPGRLLAGAGIFGGLLVFYLFQASYRLERIQTFLSQDKDPLGNFYQVKQSMLAIGSGGVLGAGLSQSTQKLYFLPDSHTDFIFAIIGEELGLLGTAVTLAFFLLILWRGLKIALAAPTPVFKMIAAGITLAIVAQALFNMTIALGLGPTKGIPLPLISYGRSSLVCSLAGIGLLLHISQKRGVRA